MQNKIIHQDEDLQIRFGDSVGDAPIQMCDTHWQTLIDHQLTEDQLCKSIRILFTLAARTLGTKNLVKHRCPVCGLSNFAYIQEAVNAACPERKNAN